MKRRDFLTHAPLAVAVSAAPAAAAAQWVAPPDENPALLALGEELPQIEAAYHDACAAWDAMWREWNPKWPLAPEPCTRELGGWNGEVERDLTGSGLVRKGRERPLGLLTLNYMEWRRDNMLAALAKNAKRKRPAARKTLAYWQNEVDRSELGIALLPGYLAECERIKRASNFDVINKARTEATDALFSFARQVLSEPSSEIQGVRIKARAVAALGRMRSYDVAWGSMKDMAGQKAHMGALLGKALLEVI